MVVSLMWNNLVFCLYTHLIRNIEKQVILYGATDEFGYI